MIINISGPRDDIDRVTDLYLSRYEIQLESALSELKTVDNLRPFVELNPYRDVLAQATQFVGYLPNVDDVTPDDSLGLDDMFEVVRKACEDYEGLQAKKEKKKAKIEELRAKQQLLSPFRPLDCDLHKVLGYRYITYRFGRIALESYHKMNKYLMDDLSAIFVEGERDESFVYSHWNVTLHGSIWRSRIWIKKPVRCFLTELHSLSQRKTVWRNSPRTLTSVRWLPG